MKDKSPVFDYVEPEDNTGYLLWQVTMRWQLNMGRALSPLDVTLTQFSLLAGLYWLIGKKEIVTQQRLADYANTDKMMTSKVLMTLEQKKLIKRANHPDDSRAKQLLMTDKGVAKLRESYQRVKEVDSSFFGPIVQRKTVFDGLLQKLIDE
jgi:DNA-binding MarR family transcriptional regulator